MDSLAENKRFTVSSEDTADRELMRALDRAVDDLEAGREYSVEDGMKKVREIRDRRKKVTA